MGFGLGLSSLECGVLPSEVVGWVYEGLEALGWPQDREAGLPRMSPLTCFLKYLFVFTSELEGGTGLWASWLCLYPNFLREAQCLLVLVYSSRMFSLSLTVY